jgi:phosphatidylglycerophosphate synthase
VPHRVVAFVVSFAIAILGMLAVQLYGRRRPVGAPLSWGEALFAATFVFLLMFWAYAVVPNQWLQWANNELGWKPTRYLAQVGQWEFINAPLPPFSISYENLRDIIVVVIYGFFLTCHIAMFSSWQARDKRAEKRAQRELAPSAYGRPLVKQES